MLIIVMIAQFVGQVFLEWNNMEKYNCPSCNIELIPLTQEENCIQEYKCPKCKYFNIYDSLSIDNWKKGIKLAAESIKNILDS